MSETKTPEPMTIDQAAKRVKRLVPELGKDNKPTGKTKEVPVTAKEVLSFKDYGYKVVVVTRDGQKLVAGNEEAAA